MKKINKKIYYNNPNKFSKTLFSILNTKFFLRWSVINAY